MGLCNIIIINTLCVNNRGLFQKKDHWLAKLQIVQFVLTKNSDLLVSVKCLSSTHVVVLWRSLSIRAQAELPNIHWHSNRCLINVLQCQFRGCHPSSKATTCSWHMVLWVRSHCLTLFLCHCLSGDSQSIASGFPGNVFIHTNIDIPT